MTQMQILHRRTFLALTGAAVAATTMPYAAPPVSAVAGALPAKPPMPTWIVGTPGEGDHYVIRAATREAAIRFRAEECEMAPADEDFVADGPCECCTCTESAGFESTRVQAWDGKPEYQITDGDWVDAGFDSTCARCSYEASQREGGRNVNGKAICADCMRIADWEIVDPEYAAELRAELEVAPFLAPAHPPTAIQPEAPPTSGEGETL